MFCSRCGSQVTDNSRFCPACGQDLIGNTPSGALGGQATELDMVRDALASEYEILEELGRGGMALVYRAKDKELEREVAIKVLPFSLGFDAEFVERFQREARTSAQLEHPNIIPIYRVGRSGRVIYFVMKYLRGGCLSNLLTGRPLTPPEIRRLLLEAGGALGYAAQRGIVHRDIKPDNIMFDEFGQCMLTDFGIAKAASGQRLTGTGMSIGTPHYMSPEQARAQAIDGRSDIYSLGVVAYQCLTGEVPYDGEDSFSIGYKHITEPIPHPQLNTADERKLYESIKRMLMKDPHDRFQTCEELIVAIQGHAVAAPGALKARAVAALAAARAPAPAVAVPAVAALADPARSPFANQATTPMASPTVDRRKSPAGRRSAPRRIADRSVAMRSGGSQRWLWIALAAAAAGAAGFYFYPRAAGPAGKQSSVTPADSIAVADTAVGSAIPDRDSVTAPRDTVSKPVSGGAVAPPVIPAATATADSGGIRIVGLPAGSNVMIDGEPTMTPVTRVPAGRHAIGISAPLRNFYQDTVDVRAGEVLEVSPVLTALGAPAPSGRGAERFSCEPAANYDAARCFDRRPMPTTGTFVPVPAGLTRLPRPAVLWVKVSAEGKTLESQRLRPSGTPAFDQAVLEFVRGVAWRPARKDGTAIDAWTQWIFPPVRP